MDQTGQDAAAVAAVRGGDVERYRELVERHERRVFAVAWSRLGDPALAEEATQEAFIRGYRRLWLLGDGAKFAAWIGAIARHAAINLGLRHRRELNKRERWALEQAPGPAAVPGEAAEPCTPEMLRKTLEELPAAHRECLVMFYLEGKSGAEAAAALGIAESALRVRLHRARAALRERLEAKLEGALEKLRPARTLVPAVMAGVLASSSAKAATGGTVALGAGAKMLSVLGKSFLMAWLVPLFSLLTNLPALLLVSVIGRKERENFREAAGFRAKLHYGFFQSFLWGFPLVLVVLFLVTHSALAAWGLRAYLFALAGLSVMVMLIALRSLTVARNAFQDTYLSLAALELLGGLDQIDREQCIQGILRLHRGKGFFTSPNSGGFNEYHIEGDARDTIAAFEALRILGALDRVKDLERWQFRPQRRGVPQGQLCWQDIEAWVAQQRLGKILQARKEHPQAPVRSLLHE